MSSKSRVGDQHAYSEGAATVEGVPAKAIKLFGVRPGDEARSAATAKDANELEVVEPMLAPAPTPRFNGCFISVHGPAQDLA